MLKWRCSNVSENDPSQHCGISNNQNFEGVAGYNRYCNIEISDGDDEAKQNDGYNEYAK
jgi:hypothetical protein